MAVLFMWMEAWIHWAKYLGYEWYNRLKWLIVQVLSIVALLIVLLWLAVFMYASFYYAYMPAITHTRDVHLQFRTDCDLTKELCSFPSANLSLSKDGVSEILMRGQPYVIVLVLDMPESPVNQNLGMFMVKLQLYTRYGETVRTSLRSSLMSYKSSLYQTLETWCFLPSLLFGSLKQKQQITVVLIDSYEEDPYKPSLGAYVEVQSKHVQIYSAALKIHAKFVGLRYLLYHWPAVSAMCGIGTNLFFLVLLTLMSWYKFGVVPDAEMEGFESSRLTLEERRSRIRAILDRERTERSRGRKLSTSSLFGGMQHSVSQPNLSSHRRTHSASFTPPRRVDDLSHSVSATNLQSMDSHSRTTNLSSASRYRASQDSVATTDYEDDNIEEYSTPSSGSGSRRSDSFDSDLRQRHTELLET